MISSTLRRLASAAGLAALAALVSCATGVDVKTGFNEHADFAKYHTWGWRLDGSIQDPVWARRFQSVLSEELAVHGLKEVPPEQAELSQPHGVFFDPRGRLHIADSSNNRILRIDR